MDGSQLLLGTAFGTVFELAPTLRLGISQSATDVILSWPAYHRNAVVESSSDLSLGFAEMSPQPSVAKGGILNTAVIPASGARFFRLRQ